MPRGATPWSACDFHPPTNAYVERTKQGLSKLDIMRRWKRYIAREIYQHLTTPPPTAANACPK
jgi:transposase